MVLVAERLEVRLGLVAGACGVALTLVALRIVARVPFGVLALDVAMAWGLLSMLQLASRHATTVPDDGWVLALGAFLPVPFLARFLAARDGVALPPALRQTWLLELVVLGLALAFLVALHRLGAARWPAAWGARLVALSGAALSGGLLATAIFQSPQLSRGAGVILGTTMLFGGLALFAQRLAARRMRGTKFEVFGSGAALFLAATQLLDGIVSYLSVRDPLGVLAGRFTEQVAFSAWLIDTTGPGYAMAKWMLALVVVYMLDGRSWPAPREDATARAATYLFIAFVGLGPGLFSATRLLG